MAKNTPSAVNQQAAAEQAAAEQAAAEQAAAEQAAAEQAAAEQAAAEQAAAEQAAAEQAAAEQAELLKSGEFVEVTFIKSPTGSPFFMAYNAGETAIVSKAQAEALLDAKIIAE